jgi:RimJ/RimL family protein N-acetyltransferase
MNNAIKTERLDLRPLDESDFGFIHELRTRPEYYQYENDEAYSDEEIAQQFSAFLEGAKSLPDKGSIQWVVSNSGVKIGEVHLWCNFPKTREWEIGWHFMIGHWGKGFATEAAKAVLEYAFANFRVNRIMACPNTENTRSLALCERIGMVKEGAVREVRLINNVYYGETIFGILKREYDLGYHSTLCEE